MVKERARQTSLLLISVSLILSSTRCTHTTHAPTSTEIPNFITPLNTTYADSTATSSQATQNSLVATPQTQLPASLEGTPLLPPSEAITIENATQLQLLGQLSNGRIQRIAITPDGMTLAVVSTAGAYIYDFETLEEQQLELDSSINDFAFNPTGGLLAVASDTSLHVWDMASRQLLHDLDIQKPVFSVNFDNEGNRLVSGGEYAVQIWDVGSGRLLQELNTENRRVLTVAFHPEGTLLVTGGTYSESSQLSFSLQLWDLNSGQVVYNLGQTTTYHHAVFSPDGSLITSANSDTSQLWETNTGRLLQTLHPYPSRFNYVPKNLVFSTDGETIIGDGGVIQQWNIKGKLINAWGGRNMTSYDSDGQKIVIQYDTSFKVLDLSTGQVERVFALPKHVGEITGLALSSDRSTLATVSNDDMIRIWDVNSGQLEHFHAAGYYNLRFVAFHPNGEILAYGGCESATSSHSSTICHNGKVTLWDLRENRAIFNNGTFTDIIKIAFSPNGQNLAISAWKGVSPILQQYNLDSGGIHGIVEGCRDFIFSPDSRSIAADCNNRIYLLDADTGNVLREFTYDGEHPNFSFSPDGKLIAFASARTGTIQIWDTSGNTDDIPLQELDGQGNLSGYIDSMAFSPDGRLLSIADGANSELYLLNLANDEILLTIHTPITELAMSSDGMLLATAEEGVVRIRGIK